MFLLKAVICHCSASIRITDHHSCLEEQVTVVGEEYSSGNHELEVEVFIAKLSAKWTNDITRDTCEELSFIMAWW